MKKSKTAPSATAKSKAFPRLMITPTVLVLLVMTAYPVAYTCFYSFTN